MKKQEAKAIAVKLLAENGYKFKGDIITAPDADSPLDAISIQDQLSDIVFDDSFTFHLQYVGNHLKLVQADI